MPQSRKRRTAARNRTSSGRAAHHAGGRGRSAGRRNRVIAAVVIVALLAAGAAYLLAPARRGAAPGTEVTTPSGLRYVDLAEGTAMSHVHRSRQPAPWRAGATTRTPGGCGISGAGPNAVVWCHTLAHASTTCAA